MDKPHIHHDALEFPDGTVVLLTALAEGQCATVLQLPVVEKPHEVEEPVKPEPVEASRSRRFEHVA